MIRHFLQEVLRTFKIKRISRYEYDHLLQKNKQSFLATFSSCIGGTGRDLRPSSPGRQPRASGVRITDTLPSYVNGSDLDETRTITAGQRMTFTINATLDAVAPYDAVITNTAYFSHTSGSSQASANFTTMANTIASTSTVYLPVILHYDKVSCCGWYLCPSMNP
jgi:hypothetical protein